MPRRLPTFFPLILAVTVGLFALTSALTAQPSAQPAPSAGEGIKRSQEENLKLYKRFADELLKLAQKWEKSDNLDEKSRSKTLRAALQLADKYGVEALFKGVVNSLGNSKNPTGGDFDLIDAKDRALVKALEEILDTLNTEDETARLQRDIADLKELIKEVARIKREQENHRARTDGNKSDPGKLARDQGALAKETKELADKLNKGNPKDPKTNKTDGNNPEPKDDKSEPKDPAKAGDPAAEPKPDSKDPKSDGKDPAGMGEPKAGGEPKGGMKPDAGSSKEAPKDAAGEPKPMSGEPKPMTGEPKPMSPSESKAQGDGKGNSKPADGMGGDSKPMNPSGGMPPGDSPPGGSKGSPSGSPSGSPPPGGPRPPNPNNPNDEAQRKVEEAVPHQKGAEEDLNNKNREDASKKEDEAIKKLNDALKELEKRLKQLREKEMLKKLEDLERRVAKMLQMQIEVKGATERIDLGVKKNANMMTTADKQKSGVEAEKEGQIAEEADRALRLLEGEGTAIVFAGVLGEARKDMKAVQDQLNRANVGAEVQLVEDQIIAQLKQMLEALKKAKQDLENPPPPPPGTPPPGEQKKNLIQLLEQLKLLRSLQIQVNERTTAFGKRSPGEQASDSFIQEQLKQLGDRQKVLQDMLHKVAAQLSQQ